MAVNGGSAVRSTPTADDRLRPADRAELCGKGPMLWCDVPVEMLLL